MAARISVMIIDDSAVVRETLKRILIEDGGFDIFATASDPIIAAKKLESGVPDLITLDIEMPRMDGLSFLRKLMGSHSIPVVICSSQSGAGSDNAMHALEYGAVEIIQKPKLGTKQFLEDSRVLFCDTLRAAHAAGTRKTAPRTVLPEVPKKLSADVILTKPAGPLRIETTEKLIVVGASTGGTEALRVFLESMPLDAPGIVIVQHMPEHFTAAFAKRLDSICAISVREARDNDTVIRGHALIAPGNRHTLLKRSGTRYFVEIKDGPLVSRHRPSVDVLFRSAARYAGKNAIGVIMTGMGDDGARGMLEMKEAGAYTIAQDEQTCIVYGMPNEAVKRGAVDVILPLGSIAAHSLKKADE